MKKTIFVTSVLVTIITSQIACAPQQSPQPTSKNDQAIQSTPSNVQTPQTGTIPSQANGKDIYNQNCAACHGPEGKGGSAPHLNTSEWKDSQKVANIVRRGKERMPGFSDKLKDNEITAVSDYVASLPK